MCVFEDEFLKIISRQNRSDEKSNSILLSFTGIGHAMGGLNVQKPEFYGTGRVFDNVIFITDKKRSWGNQLDFEFIKETIEPFVDGRKVYSIGNSMGGFNAIISTCYIPTEICVAFAPQYSVHSSIAPWENRWKEYTSHIADYRFDSVKDYFNDETGYFIFSSGYSPDREHATQFPVRENIHHFCLPHHSHHIANELKVSGALESVIQYCFDHRNQSLFGFEYDVLSPKTSGL